MEAEAGRKDDWSLHWRVALMEAELRFGVPPGGGHSGRRGKLEGRHSQGLGPCLRSTSSRKPSRMLLTRPFPGRWISRWGLCSGWSSAHAHEATWCGDTEARG